MASLQEIEALLDRQLEPVLKWFDGVDERFDGLDKRLDGIGKHLGELHEAA